jgi:hypothetical protein
MYLVGRNNFLPVDDMYLAGQKEILPADVKLKSVPENLLLSLERDV